MKRTFKFTQVNAVAVSFVDGKVVSRELEPHTYTGRQKSKSALEKIFLEQLNEDEKKIPNVMITGSEELNKVYEFDFNDFLKIAKEVKEENSEESDEEVAENSEKAETEKEEIK